MRIATLKTIAKRTLIVILILGFVGMIGCAGYVYMCLRNAPGIDTSDIYSLLDQKTIFYDKDGKKIDSISYYDGNRTIIAYDQMSPDLVNAVVAIEDKTFWEHHGFNYIRMIGAIKEKMFGGGQISGTSTITQQLARNVYLSEIKSERTLKRKIIEAYYTVLLERSLSKQKIIEAYLNTVYFGFGSYGVQTASQNYFGKNASELSLLESAALAALPQAPDTYALMYPDYTGDSSLPTVDTVSGTKYVYNGDASQSRRNLVLSLMVNDGFITNEQAEEAKAQDLKASLKVTVSKDDAKTSYFVDYVIDCLQEDLSEELGITLDDASQMLYSGGLNVYTTIDVDKQQKMVDQFENMSNFTGISGYRTDSEGNIVSNKGKVLLLKKSSYVGDGGAFLLSPDAYKRKDDGDLVIKAGHGLSISEDGTSAVIALKDMYTYKDGGFVIYKGAGVNLPQEYVSVNSDGDAVVKASLFDDLPDAIAKDGDIYRISSNYISGGQNVRQPQAAAVLIENASGYVRAMVGGRGVSGRNLYNRAVSPHQPGSSIKPIAVYGPALQISADMAKDGETMKLDYEKGDKWGKYISAGSVINDAPMYRNGVLWPKNAYAGYRGKMTLRKAVQESVNVCAVKVFSQIGEDKAVAFLKKNGITTVDESGAVNDLNPAALALGGMSSGITPLEMAAAYETFPNGGMYKEPLVYTKVVDRKGNKIIEKEQKSEKVYDESVAWIMTDILQTVVTRGIARRAAIGIQPVGGKTGTTSDQYDIWFSGFTPEYTMALWEGNDLHLELSSMSEAAASFWSRVMYSVSEGSDRKSFRDKPEDVSYIRGEYYAPETYSGAYLKPETSKTTEKKTTETKKENTRSAPTRETTFDPDTNEWFQEWLSE